MRATTLFGWLGLASPAALVLAVWMAGTVWIVSGFGAALTRVAFPGPAWPQPASAMQASAGSAVARAGEGCSTPMPTRR